jgi:hypothetical protein
MRIDVGTGLGIAVMDVRHEEGRLVGSQPIAVASVFADGPRWSPDGKKLVYSAAEEGRGWQTYIADLGAGSSQQLSAIPENSIDPDWSPDGSRIVFSYYPAIRQIRDLFVINTDGCAGRLTVPRPIKRPAWSPAGPDCLPLQRRIRFKNPKRDIFIMDSAGSVLSSSRTATGDFVPARIRDSLHTSVGGIPMVQ